MSTTMDDSVRLRLSAQRALWGAVTPKLRAVSAERRAGAILWRAVFEAAPTDEERELLQVAGTEVLADFSDVRDFEEQILVVAPPAAMEHLAQLMYLRHE